MEVKEGQYHYDLANLRHKEVAEWSKEDVRLIVETLMDKIKPALTRKNLGLQMLNRN